MSGNEALIPVEGSGWQRGMANLLRGEFSSWFGRRRWLTNSLIWIALVDIILFMVLIQARFDPEFDAASADLDLVVLYTIFGGLFVAVGVVIAMQGEIVGEKNSGTAAWVLSKPVSRPAFVLSKALGNALGLLFTAVLVPGVIAYLLYSLVYFGEFLPVGGFLGAITILGLHALFWMTLTLMLGTFFSSWGPVIAIPMALLFGQQFIVGMIPLALYVLPWTMVSPVGEMSNSISAALILGEAPPTWLPVISAAVLSVVFLVVAVWRFQREEL